MGVGITTGLAKLHLYGSSQIGIVESSGNYATSGSGYLRWKDVNGNAAYVGFGGNANNFDIFNSLNGAITFGVNASEQMRLTSTGLGIGTTSPSKKLEVNSGSAIAVRLTRSGGTVANLSQEWFDGTNSWYAGVSGSSFFGIAYNTTGGAIDSALLRLDISGNLGLGVTPSATPTGIKSINVGSQGYVFSDGVTYKYNSGITNNAYVNGNNSYAAITSRGASIFELNGDTFIWKQASTGTASSTLSLTSAMTLDASGNLGVGTTSPARPLEVLRATAGFVSRRGYSSGQSIYEYTDATAAYISTGSNLYNAFGINETSSYLNFYTANAERARIDSSGNLGIGTTSPNASAILDAQSTTKGVRFPNMTTTQKNAISSPAAGLVVFDTTLAKLCVYSGSAWQTITSI